MRELNQAKLKIKSLEDENEQYAQIVRDFGCQQQQLLKNEIAHLERIDVLEEDAHAIHKGTRSA